MQLSLEAAGYTGNIATGGIVTGFILDADGNGISGATMGCGSCSPYYGDGDTSDGLFTTAGSMNTTTDAAAARPSRHAARHATRRRPVVLRRTNRTGGQHSHVRHRARGREAE